MMFYLIAKITLDLAISSSSSVTMLVAAIQRFACDHANKKPSNREHTASPLVPATSRRILRRERTNAAKVMSGQTDSHRQQQAA
jgi:hypothetical protein